MKNIEKIAEYILQVIGTDVTEIEKIMGIVILIIGIAIGLFNAVISFFSIMSSNNIEIAFMTKREQWKHRIMSLLTLIVAMWILYFMYGYACKVVVDFYPFIVISIIAGVVFIFALLLMFGRWFVKRLYSTHLCRAICFVVKNFVIWVGHTVYKRTEVLRSGCKMVIEKVLSLRVIKWICLKVSGFRIYIHHVWVSCEKEANDSNKSKKLQKGLLLRLLAFTDVWILGILFNCMCEVYGKGNYNLVVGSTLLVILSFEISALFLPWDINPGDARIFYHDTFFCKDVFIYFRYNEEYFIGGDVPKMASCNEYFLIPYKRIQEVKLLPVSKNKKKDLLINYQRVMLQTTSGEYTLAKVLDKVKEELQDQNITQTKVDETSIYIKPSDKKAYYVAPDNVTGSVEL